MGELNLEEQLRQLSEEHQKLEGLYTAAVKSNIALNSQYTELETTLEIARKDYRALMDRVKQLEKTIRACREQHDRTIRTADVLAKALEYIIDEV